MIDSIDKEGNSKEPMEFTLKDLGKIRKLGQESKLKRVPLMDEMASRIASQMIDALDERIKAAFEWVIGTSDINTIKKQTLMCARYQHVPYEDWILNGQLILRAWPGKVNYPDNSVEGYEATFSREYEEHYKKLPKHKS